LVAKVSTGEGHNQIWNNLCLNTLADKLQPESKNRRYIPVMQYTAGTAGELFAGQMDDSMYFIFGKLQ